MAATWPASLQQVLNEQGFTYEIGDTAIRSEMETGMPKVRRRFTKPINKLSCSILLNISQYSTFSVFFNTTLNGGVNTFNFNNPLSASTSEFRFITPPQISPLGGQVFQVSMQWEEIPQ